MTKVLVTGSRGWSDGEFIHKALIDHGATEIAQGGAVGADCLAWRAAEKLGIPCKTYQADWSKGRGAGLMRNLKMLNDFRPDVVLAFWDGESHGTKHMMDVAKQGDFEVVVYIQHAHGISRRRLMADKIPSLFGEHLL